MLKVGSSAAVTIPKKSLEELGLRIGDQVSVEIDEKRGFVMIRKAKAHLSKADEMVAVLTAKFIERYRKDLEALARE